MIVLDASIAIAWAFDEEDSIELLSGPFSQEPLRAPPIWRQEVVNVILRKERQKLITAEQGDGVLGFLEGLGVEIIDRQHNHKLADLARFARPYQLSSYDAAYLDLALNSAAILFTHDNNLRQAAKRLGLKTQ